MNASVPTTRFGFVTRKAWAAVLLAAYFVFLVFSVADKSPAYDEGVHAAAGYSYWARGDFRMNPENGNLPQRLIGLPFVFGTTPLPAVDGPAWKRGDEWAFADAWFYRMGHDPIAIAAKGRAAAALLAVALCALVWAWARQLFGPKAGLLALVLAMACPSLLANGPLMASDTAAALFFLAATWALWAALARLTIPRAALAGLAVGGLFASKMSATLIVPIALLLLIVRLAHRDPLHVALGPNRIAATSRTGRGLALAALGALGALTAYCVLWGFYDFRFSMARADPAWHPSPTWSELLAEPTPQVVDRLGLTPPQRSALEVLIPDRVDWTTTDRRGLATAERDLFTPGQVRRLHELLRGPALPLVPRVVGAARQLRILPEAFLYGTLYAWHFSHWRDSFLNGSHFLFGTWKFFPYTFLVKTPIALLLLGLFGVTALVVPRANRGDRLYATAPLWILLLVYWAAVETSPINIGHRHILATYPPCLILASAGALWLESRSVLWRYFIGLEVLALLAGVLGHFPNYLAYTNAFVRSDRAYTHLVDSSLDWGQELPAIGRFARAHAAEGPVYVSYFGSGSPSAYGVSALFTACAVPSEDIPGSLAVTEEDMAADQVEARIAVYERDHPEYEVVSRRPVADGRTRVLFLKTPEALRLHPGLYVISATRLQQILYNQKAPWGPWNARAEGDYQRLRRAVAPLLGADRFDRRLALTEGGPHLLQAALDFDALRFARLTAYLRTRPPETLLGDSVVVFRVSAEDLAAALDGPPPELKDDLSSALIPMTPRS